VRTFEPLRVPAGTAFTLTLPDNTFTHSVATTPVQVSATTAGGTPLPDWLKFSPGERQFSGTPPQGVTSLQVAVVATDANGNQVSTTLNLQFGDPAR
jgi:phage-related protein